MNHRHLLIVTLFITFFTSASFAEKTHGIAMHGKPKYEESFAYLDYVNPNAAKGDVEPPVSCEEIDDTQAKKEIAERMRQRLLQLTQEHDSKYMIDIADPK